MGRGGAGQGRVTVDPRSDVSHRQYVYVLVTRPPSVLAGGRPGSSVTLKQSDSVEIYQQYSGERVFHMTFHPSLTFSQLRLMGSEVNRTLLLLTDSGRVYTVPLNETQLNRPRSFTVQLTLRVINHSLPDLPVKQIHTSYSSALFITGDGSVYVETHSAGVHRHLFGSLQGFSPNNVHTPMLLPLSYKVVKCSLGLTHLCLLDESGRVFMQGSNNHGQLGTGDKIDRREPTQVVLSLTPVDVCCGLNHSLALLRGETGEKEVQGCGCGRGGRLPGWAQGSPVFVRLSVKAPRSTRALCSSKYYLYLLCCHDIAEPLLFHTPPPGAESEMEAAEREGLQRCLSQLRGCGHLWEQLAKLREAVQSHMTLSSAQKDFLEEALSTMQQGSSSTTEFQL
ncbi:F-box only protein 24-like [Anguilla anguilla]|nr:F-box only protein 24-like [Anguilla anguilla]